MSRCACEFEQGKIVHECQFHKEIRLEARRLAEESLAKRRPEVGGSPGKWERCCLKCWLIDAIHAWFEGPLIHRNETLNALSQISLEALVAEDVPHRSELN